MLQASAQELGIEVTSTGNLGSDQQAFTQAGIVATGIGIGGNRVHCLQDTPDQVQITSLQKGSALAARITAKAMQKLAER